MLKDKAPPLLPHAGQTMRLRSLVLLLAPWAVRAGGAEVQRAEELTLGVGGSRA